MSNENEGVVTPGEELDSDTKEILAELEAEGHEMVPPAEAKPKEEEAPEPKPKAEEDGGKPVEKPVEKPTEEVPADKPKTEEENGTKRDISYVPAYKLKVAESQHQKREKELLGQIEALSQGQKPTEDGKPASDDTPPKPTADAEAKAKALAEKHNISEELALDLVNLNPGKAELPPEVIEKLNALDDIKLERQAEEAAQAFSTEFAGDGSEKNPGVLAAIKAEYPHASDKELSQVKDRLFELAHSEQYHTVPLEEIYAGRKEFRGLIQPPTPTGEVDRGGSHVATETVDFANVTEKDIGEMDADTFEKYSDYMASQERK